MKYINSKKLEELKINKRNVYYVIDFDKTITTNESDDSWGVSGKLLGQEFEKEINQLYKKYRPIELDYKITIQEKEKAMIEWYEKCMNLYFKYNLTKEKLIKSVHNSNLEFRDGVKEFFYNSFQENIPIIILSAGIGNVIEEFLKEESCYFNNINIISNFMEFDEKGQVKKFDNSKIIHTLNKSLIRKVKKELLEKIKNKTYKILIGDLKEDEKMIEEAEWDTTLKIGILDNNTLDVLNIYKEAFDIVLTGKDATFDIFKEIVK